MSLRVNENLNMSFDHNLIPLQDLKVTLKISTYGTGFLYITRGTIFIVDSWKGRIMISNMTWVYAGK